MSIFAIKNNEGKWLGCEIYCDEPDWFEHGGFMWDTRSVAEENVKLYNGHVVELVEAPAKVVVSEDEAEMLKWQKYRPGEAKPASNIAGYIAGHKHDYGSHNSALDEDRLMRAYVNGWTVEKPKRYVLPMDGTVDEDAEYQMYAIVDSGIWGTVSLSDSCAAPTVTQADIDAAPDWVKAIMPVEVTDDDD